MYCDPRSIMTGISVKNRSTVFGKKNIALKKTAAITAQQHIIKPMVLRMFFMSPAPKNCARNVEQPAQNPQHSRKKTKKTLPATPTADSSLSPRLPTIRLSINVSEDVTRPCTEMGRATFAMFLYKVLESTSVRRGSIAFLSQYVAVTDEGRILPLRRT